MDRTLKTMQRLRHEAGARGEMATYHALNIAISLYITETEGVMARTATNEHEVKWLVRQMWECYRRENEIVAGGEA